MHPSVKYAHEVVDRVVDAPKYVVIQCTLFLEIAEGKDPKYTVNWQTVKMIDGILKLMIMPKGGKRGKIMYDCLVGYQWLLIVASIAVVYRDDPHRRKYEKVVLEIGRKNFKTFTIAIIFIILLILEPKFSAFYSVAPDGTLSAMVNGAINMILKASPLLFRHNGKERFKILNRSVMFKAKESTYEPLNYSNSRMDGREPNVFLADEVGDLPNSYAITAMESGQLLLDNKLGFVISTKYPTISNPLEDEVAYAKKVLDGIIEDDGFFALLYEPDMSTNALDRWMTDDSILRQANPASYDNPKMWNALLKRRRTAIAIKSEREEFLTKLCNIIYSGRGVETYIDVQAVRACQVDKIDWEGRDVWLGVDLSMTNDNTSVAMVSEENGNIIFRSWCFIPRGRIDQKNAAEKIDYRKYIEDGDCFACGDLTIDYGFVEDFVFSLEEKLGVHIVSIGYDRWNALSSAQKWDQKYNTVEIKQHSSVLHPPTKLLYEKIVNREASYEPCELLEINFENAQCQFDTNMNRYVSKKKSTGKVDMVVSLINAVYLIQQDVFLNDGGFVAQII